MFDRCLVLFFSLISPKSRIPELRLKSGFFTETSIEGSQDKAKIALDTWRQDGGKMASATWCLNCKESGRKGTGRSGQTAMELACESAVPLNSETKWLTSLTVSSKS